ncbi:MAG TPA: hypothetical protein VIL35_01290 [Vicinamibacterales bacterium]
MAKKATKAAARKRTAPEGVRTSVTRRATGKLTVNDVTFELSDALLVTMCPTNYSEGTLTVVGKYSKR